MPEFNGDGTAYSARATEALWEIIQERMLDSYEQDGTPTSWIEFCEDNGVHGSVGSHWFDTSLRRQLEFEVTMPDEMWMLIVDLVNWSEITDTLVAEFNRITDEMNESKEDEEDDDAE